MNVAGYRITWRSALLGALLTLGHAHAATPADAESAAAGQGAVVRVLDPQATTAERVVVVLHGLGSDPTAILGIFDGMSPAVRVDIGQVAPTVNPRKSLVFVAPPGPIDRGPSRGFAWFPYGNSGYTEAQLYQSMLEAADRVALLLDQLAGTAEKTPVVTGFSQGGLVCLALAVHHPESVSLAIPISGWLPKALLPETIPAEGGPRIVALHGTADDRVPFNPTKDRIEQLRAMGWNTEMKAYDGVQHSMSIAMRRELHTLIRDAP
jgi:phospholipase/carboxylesterase